MMVLLDGEPFGKASSLCKRSLKAFILLFISVCKMWVRIRLEREGLLARAERSVPVAVVSRRLRPTFVFGPLFLSEGDSIQRVVRLVQHGPVFTRSPAQRNSYAMGVSRCDRTRTRILQRSRKVKRGSFPGGCTACWQRGLYPRAHECGGLSPWTDKL